MSVRSLVWSLLILACLAPLPVAAQAQRPAPRPLPPPPPPAVMVRPFALFSQQQFTAKDTFDAVFEQSSGPFWGGGAQVVWRGGLFVEVGVSRFKQTGQRVFVLNGDVFPLRGPDSNPQTLTATITPVEVTAGYRARVSPRVIPYVGGGFGFYKYEETSAFAQETDDVDVNGNGFLVVGGAEFRLHKWIGLTADLQYSSITGILGEGGVSQELEEDDLGGLAVRVRFVVGR